MSPIHENRPSVERLSSAHREEAVGVLCESFHDYPVMRHVLSDAGPTYDERLTALVEFICERRLENNGWLLGLAIDGALAGVAVCDGPASEAETDEEDESRQAQTLVRAIGGEAVARLEAYDEVGEALMPAGNYHYLGMLGVRERRQGMGLGRQLVEATQALAAESTRSSGVCLHTEAPQNVPLYERLGFEVVGEADIASMHTWCMFWPCP